MRLIPLTLVILASSAELVNAEPTAAKGVGVATCTEFAEKYKADPNLAETIYFSWAQGFMSGWNYKLLYLNQPVYARDLSLCSNRNPLSAITALGIRLRRSVKLS